GLEHQSPCWAHADTIAAVNAGGIGQRDLILGRDVGIKAASGYGNREGTLRIHAAGLDALVAENTFRVVSHVQVVVNLWRLGHGLSSGPEALRTRAVALH